MKLSHLKEKQCGLITDIDSSLPLCRRLLDMGFVDGAHIQCTNIAFSGSPIAYVIRGSKLALRKKDADNIGVSLC